MKTAYIDCIFGVSGDMILSAFVACGMPFDYLKENLAKLGLHGYELSEEHVVSKGIAAVHINVQAEEHHSHRHLSHITEMISASSPSGQG